MQILHVDDEPDIREIAQMSLEMSGGFNVVSVGSAQDALERLNDFKPDAILLDVMMPEMDGPGLFRVLRSRDDCTDIPVVFMTAAAQRQSMDELMSLGATGVISKPFDPMTLGAELQEVLNTAP